MTDLTNQVCSRNLLFEATLYMKDAPDWRLVVADDPLEVLHGELLYAGDGGVVTEGGREPPPAHHYGEDRVAVAERGEKHV